MQRFYKKHGHLIIATERPRPIGYHVYRVQLFGGEMVTLPQPFRVTGEVTAREYYSQFPKRSPHDPDCRHYYKIVTD